MKKIVTLICTLLFANVLLAQVGTTFWIDSLQYEITSTNPAEVEVNDANVSITIANIPETVTDNGTTYSVTSIGEVAFGDCISLTSVTIPNSVTSIGNVAFGFCISLTSITIPNSVTSIGRQAFSGCSSLTSVTLPNNATIDESAFYNAGPFSQNDITIDNIIYRTKRTNGIIGNYTFNNVGEITFYLNGNTYNLIRNVMVHGFHNNNSTIVNIPETINYNGATYRVTSIGEAAFQYHSSLTSITIPNSVTSIGEWAFFECSRLTSITIPNSVTSIDFYAFYSCSSLTSVTLPTNATIDESAFYNAGPFSQNDITIDNIIYRTKRANVIIGNYTFNSVGEITFYLNGNTTYNQIGNVGVYQYQNNPTIVNIPETVSYEGTTYRVTEIVQQAFYGCSSLTSITIPNSVTKIGNWAFAGCSSLTSVTIPNSVTSIGNRAFAGCSSLTTLNFNAVYCNNFSSGSDYPFYNLPITTINIGDSVERIPAYFAYNLDSLTSVTIPNSVTSIGGGAFYNCSSLTSVTLSNNITSLLDYDYNGFFEDCSSLTSITIPNSVTKIGDYAFKNCSSLTSVTIGNSATSIGYEAFYECISLTSVTIPNSVTFIGSYAFYECSSLTSVTIPNSVTTIGNNAFDSCSALTSVSLDMSSIPANLFPQSVPLQNLTFGENVNSIASGAFSPYSFLQNVTCLATTPPTLADNTVFPYPNIATLTVPCGTLEAYSAPTSFWNMFFMGRIEEDCNNEGGDSGLEDVEDTELSFYPNPTNSKITFSSTIESIEVMDLTGRCVLTFSNAREINIESLPSGAYYLRLTNNDKAIMRKVIKE